MLKHKVKAVVTDIEGTTTSISFVKDILFPYAADNVQHFLTQNWDLPEFNELKGRLFVAIEEQAKLDSDIIVTEQLNQVINNIKTWIRKDKKITILKELQGIMWKEAYEQGIVKGHLYPDVVPVLKTLKANDIKLYVYSSGSVQAQKLLYAHSDQGDITYLFDGYFDTNVGPKMESSSYLNISKALKLDPTQILFLTDAEKEGVAARVAGFKVQILSRPGNAPLSEETFSLFPIITSFNQIEACNL